MVGNSSSGIIEAGSFELPVVNVGSRQQGRIKGPNVINCAPERGSIETAIARARSRGFRAGLAGMTNPYGSGNAARIIADTLASVEFGRWSTLKSFYDG